MYMKNLCWLIQKLGIGYGTGTSRDGTNKVLVGAMALSFKKKGQDNLPGMDAGC